MGIGCVLIFWAIAGLVAATAAAVVLSLIVFFLRRRFPTLGRGWLVLAAVLPFLFLAYAGAAFLGYAWWCESVRGVDSGIGDSWRVPLPNGWRFTMIDVPDAGYLTSSSGRQLHHTITSLGVKGPYVFGRDETGSFVADTRGDTSQSFETEAAFTKRLAQIGASAKDLRTASWFYYERRWTSADAFAVVVIAIPPAIAGLLLLLRMIVVMRRTPR